MYMSVCVVCVLCVYVCVYLSVCIYVYLYIHVHIMSQCSSIGYSTSLFSILVEKYFSTQHSLYSVLYTIMCYIHVYTCVLHIIMGQVYTYNI